MIERRAITGFVLLSALLFGALPTQSAFGAESKNTTAFTCVKKGGAKDFKDAHCTETTIPELGEYGHELIPSGATEIEITNEATANKTTEAAVATLKAKVPGGETHIEAKTVSGTGTIENSGTGTDHDAAWSIITNLINVIAPKPANCKVKEPIVIEATGKGVDELNGAEKNMGLEFVSKKANFTEITYEGEKCALKGKAFPVTGTLIGTGAPGGNARETGATTIFANEKEMQSLKLGAEPATFTATVTTRMKGGGNPISLTTTT